MGLDLGIVSGLIELRDTFTKTLDNAGTKLTEFGDRIDKETERTKGVSAGLDAIGTVATRSGLALTAGLTGPIVLVGGAVAKLGIDAVESRNLMEVSFGSMISSADAWAKDLSKNLGLNRFEMEKTAGTMFNMVSSMGLGKDAAFQVSTGVVKLAADMASFRNISIDDALTKLKAGLVGETEPLKSVGILVDENTVKAYAYKNGIAAQGAELTAQQKVLARYGAIMQQTSNDQGDLARTMESPANQLRIMQSRVQEAATELGESLVPVISEVVSVVSKMVPYIQQAVEIFTSLPEPVKIGGVALAGVAAAAGPALLAVGTLTSTVSKLLPLMGEGATVASVMSKAMGMIGPAVAIAATAFAAWEIGKWIGENTGATKWVEHFSGRLMGLTDAEMNATDAAVKQAEAHKGQAAAVKGAAVDADTLNKALEDEIHKQKGLGETTVALNLLNAEAAKRHKEHADALRDVNEKIASAMVMNNNLTDAQIKQAESYKTLGLSIADIALKMGVAETAVQHYFDVTKKSEEGTKELWRAHYDAITKDSQTSADAQKADIQRWFDHEVSLLDKSDKNYKAHYDALAATAQDKVNAIGDAFTALKDKSIEATQQKLKAEQDAYDKMLAGGLHFSQEVLDEQRKKIQDLKDKLSGMGSAGKKAFDDMTEAANNNTSAMIKAAEEADKARKANQAMGGAFEITRENFEPSARGLGYDPGLVENLLKKGYSFQQALLWSKHSDWPPPQNPGPRVQGFAEGGMVMVGEHGPEAVRLPWQSLVYPNSAGKPGAGDGGIHIDNLTMHVNGTGEDVARKFQTTIMTKVKMRRKFGAA